MEIGDETSRRRPILHRLLEEVNLTGSEKRRQCRGDDEAEEQTATELPVFHFRKRATLVRDDE